MQISRPDEHTVLLARLEALPIELLRCLPQGADPGDNAAARARLFSAPTHAPEEAELAEDWQNLVVPELQKLFRSSVEVIAEDLQKLRLDQRTGEAALPIPADHLDQWIHGLNQARLALAARHEFTEHDMEQAWPLGSDPRAFALLQVRFYGVIQELLLRELEDD